MKNKLIKIKLATLISTLTLISSCADNPTLQFPNEAEVWQRYLGSSTSEITVSSSSAESSSSSATISSSSSAQSSSSSLKGCTIVFNPKTHFCYDGSIYPTCNEMSYNPSTHYCDGIFAVPAKCNGKDYNPLTHGCCDNKLYEFSTQFCVGTEIYDKCGGSDYDPLTKFCYNNSKIGTFCGSRPETFDPDLYKCEIGDKIYLGTPVPYEGGPYDAVLIGEQTWMTKNLNYNVEGSKCGDGSVLSSTNTTTCDTYGRLYNWATAMGIDAEYNYAEWGESDVKHQGICPDGWHISSKAEWTTLIDFVGDNAVRKLKAIGYWRTDDGTDAYGFAALPGGNSGSGGDSFINVGNRGFWWITSEDNANQALSSGMIHNVYEQIYLSSNDKSLLVSVRCLKD